MTGAAGASAGVAVVSTTGASSVRGASSVIGSSAGFGLQALIASMLRSIIASKAIKITFFIDSSISKIPFFGCHLGFVFFCFVSCILEILPYGFI